MTKEQDRLKEKKAEVTARKKAKTVKLMNPAGRVVQVVLGQSPANVVDGKLTLPPDWKEVKK